MSRIRNQDDERKAQHYTSIILELEYCPVHLLRVQAFPCAHPNQWETQPEPDWLLSMLPWDTLETQEVTLTYSHCRNNFHWVPSSCKRAFWSFECFWVLARCFLASYHVKSSCNFDHQLCLDAAMAEQNQGTSGACPPLSWSVLEPGVHVMLQPWAKVNRHATSNLCLLERLWSFHLDKVLKRNDDLMTTTIYNTKSPRKLTGNRFNMI